MDKLNNNETWYIKLSQYQALHYTYKQQNIFISSTYVMKY